MSDLVQLVVQLREGGSDQLLAQWSGGLPVEVDVGHGVDGVVSEGAEVVGVGVGVVVVVLLAASGGVQAALTHHRVPVLRAVPRRRVRTRGREVHDAKPALGFLAAGRGVLERLGGVFGWGGVRAGALRHQVHLEAAQARCGTGWFERVRLGEMLARGGGGRR